MFITISYYQCDSHVDIMDFCFHINTLYFVVKSNFSAIYFYTFTWLLFKAAFLLFTQVLHRSNDPVQPFLIHDCVWRKSQKSKKIRNN